MLPLACVFSTGLLVGNRLDHDPHLGFAGKEGSGTLEGKHDQEMVWGISLSVNQSIRSQQKEQTCPIFTPQENFSYPIFNLIVSSDPPFLHFFSVASPPFSQFFSSAPPRWKSHQPSPLA